MEIGKNGVEVGVCVVDKDFSGLAINQEYRRNELDAITLDGAFHGAVFGLELATDEADSQDGQDRKDVFFLHLI